MLSEEPQAKPFEITNVGSGIGTSVADIAAMLARNWSRDIAVRFSGVIREGDPFSLVANSTLERAAGFNWQIPVARGIEDYVAWFREKVH
jgi:UDP-glucose 4-epimerase